MTANPTTWPGGTIRYAADGTPTYHIRRTLRGRRYEVSTRCATLRGALVELSRFEADPEAYIKKPEPVARPVVMDSRLVTDYLRWCCETRQPTIEYVREKQRILELWRQALAGRDLRSLRVTDLVQILDSHPVGRQRRNAIAFIKHLYTWLITVRFLVESHQNPSAALRVPQSDPNRRAKQVKRLTPETLTAVRPHLADRWRDCLDVLSGTGIHITELDRFARAGQVLHTLQGKVLQIPKHKRGGEFRVAVTEETAETAARVRAEGGFNKSRFHGAIQRACEAAGVEAFAPGQLRHTVASYAVEAGASMEAVSTFLNHATLETTKRFYARHAIPAKVPTMR